MDHFFSSNSIKKIWFYLYELKLKQKPIFRQGSLLKIEFSDEKVGHADLHPWPEKGEEPLTFHLKKLKSGIFTALTARALDISYQEAIARAKGCNILNGLFIPQSHYLILDIENLHKKIDTALKRGFKIFKLKLGTPLPEQTNKILNVIKAFDPSVKWRIDFHQNLNPKEWEDWSQTILNHPYIKNRLDFIEAPFNYTENQYWKDKTLPLALDVWGGDNSLPVSVLVWKSSRKKFQLLLKNNHLFQRVVFTHCLAHPLDQLASAYEAACFYRIKESLRETCGLVQADIYEKNSFSLMNKGPVFPILSGPGWGFDHLLHKLSWKNLSSYF